MSRLIYGDGIGKLGKLTLCCGAIIFDTASEKVLLTRRSDNGRWCIPGGAMNAGESAVEACAREVLEETGLEVRVGKLIGVYTNPHFIIEYADGNRIQPVGLCFEAEPIAGGLCTTEETTELGYFSLEEMKSIDVLEDSMVGIIDAFAGSAAAFVR